MQNPKTPPPQGTGKGPILAVTFGCLGIILLGILVLIVVVGIAYFQGYSLPSILPSTTQIQTGTLSTRTLTSTLTFTPNPTFTTTQTPTSSPSPTATIIFHLPTLIPTSTKTPIPHPTKTHTPIPTKTPAITVINDTQYDFSFNTWIGLASQQAYGKGMRCSSTKGELLSFDSPSGVAAISLVLYRAPNQGKVRILVDDTPVETLDLYWTSPQYRYEWKYQFSKPLRAHQVKVIVLHEKRNSSKGYQICFDGSRIGSAFTDDANYGIRYGSWSGVLNEKAMARGYRLSSNKNASVTFTTFGRSFQWITARGPNYGQAAIYADAILVATVDLYHPAQAWQQTILVDNLGQGFHTVSIVVLGQNQPASGGSAVLFDGISIP